MTINPKTLPDGTVVEYTNHAEDYFAVAELPFTFGRTERITRVFVPVPDGVAYDDALRAVNDTRPWVPLPDGPTKAHEGSRVRAFGNEEKCIVSSGPLVWESDLTVLVGGQRLNTSAGWDWFVHPDDVPDPDADLIERIADKMAALGYEPVAGQTYAAFMRDYARAALAVIREAQS